MKDLTKNQYRQALERRGMRLEAFGYVKVNETYTVHPLNGGPTYRQKLAYAIRRQEETTQSLKRDPLGRTCPECVEELGESIPLDSNGTCHGCGCNFGRRG